MKTKYKISIIVPVYNVEKYLGRCLNSILEQEYTNWEAILVDDGSTDSSGSICDEYVKNDQRYKVIHQKNRGLSDARNSGIKVASGEIIIFVDSDDWIEKNTLEIIISSWKEGLELCIFDYYEARSEREREHVRCLNKKLVDFSYDPKYNKKWAEQAINYLHREEKNAKMIGSVWGSAFCAKSIKEKNIYFPSGTQLIEDRAFMLKCFSELNRIIYISKPIYNYYYNPNSLTYTSYSKDIDNKIEIMKRLNYYVEEVAYSNNDRAIADHFRYVQILILVWRLAFDSERKFQSKCQEYCATLAANIDVEHDSSYKLLDLLVIYLCKFRLFSILKILIRIRGK